MAKLPKYMSLELKGRKAFIHIKKWGIPIIVFNAMHQFEGLRWYHWLVFPRVCLRMMRGGLNEH